MKIINKKKTYTGRYQDKGSTLFSFKKINWYWDIRIWSPLYLLILLSIILSTRTSFTETTEEISFSEPIIEVVETTEEPIPETTISLEEEEIIALARLADSVAEGRSEDVKRVVMWVAINRTEDRSNGYGMTLLDEINRPKQWQGYNPEGIYLETTLSIAKEVHDTWQGGRARMIPQDMLWFVLNKDGSITVRNQYKDGKNRAEMTFGQ